MAPGDDPAAGPVWLDLEHEQLRRGDKPLHLRPKSFALLRYLVAHPGRVLSKDELVEAVWPKTAISDGVLMVSSNEVRQALGDMAQAPQYLDVLWRRRSLPAGPGGPGAALPRDGWCAAGRMAGAARPDLLVQMPALLAADALEAAQRRVLGATRERMLRELTEALDALTAERTLVLALEDLHWSDAATLDLV